jgi:hypothetical protein
MRWFLYGAGATLGATVVMVSKARTMREKLAAEGVARISANFAAVGLDGVGTRLQRSALRVQDGQANDGSIQDGQGPGNLAAR